MAVKIVILLCALLLGCLAVPVPEEDLSIFFPETRGSRIVGGHLASHGAHPWIAALNGGTTVRIFGGGGSIISQRTILTAAHCIAIFVSGNTLQSGFRVTLGTNIWNGGGGDDYLVSGFVIHPEYSRPNIKFDIGVLYTASNIVFTNTVRPIPINYDFVGQGIWTRLAGWGGVVAQGAIQSQLREIDLPTIDVNQCARTIAEGNFGVIMPPVDPRIEFCTFRAVGQGACGGDSGSPLIRSDRGQQIGIVSWGLPCARGVPDVYVRLSAFQTWIQQHTMN